MAFEWACCDYKATKKWHLKNLNGAKRHMDTIITKKQTNKKRPMAVFLDRETGETDSLALSSKYQ